MTVIRHEAQSAWEAELPIVMAITPEATTETAVTPAEHGDAGEARL
jgi:hypothetical protein